MPAAPKRNCEIRAYDDPVGASASGTRSSRTTCSSATARSYGVRADSTLRRAYSARSAGRLGSARYRRATGPPGTVASASTSSAGSSTAPRTV
ncbi:hypothetical protein ACFQV2_09080 [Actinokineospora soli]|uniref:Uncharacterized protein n=1 Tax=Actinokineospora soli TaxID=1048753 RepID=A0ABW2TJL9_9PSEU